MSTSYMTVRPVLDASTAEEVTPLAQEGNEYEKTTYDHGQQAQHAPFQVSCKLREVQMNS